MEIKVTQTLLSTYTPGNKPVEINCCTTNELHRAISAAVMAISECDESEYVQTLSVNITFDRSK